MSITPRRLAALLLLLWCHPSPAEGQNDAGLRHVRNEAKQREQFVLDLVPRLVAQDDALVSGGLDDPVRQRRVNRLLGMNRKIFSAGVESLAVAAACLDFLAMDPALQRTALSADVRKGAEYALQALIPSIPQLQTPLGGNWSALRLLGRDRGGPADSAGENIDPLVNPSLLAPAGPRIVLNELSSRVVRPEGCTGFLWIPGSQLLLTWGAAGLKAIDADHPEAIRVFMETPIEKPVVASASGEYLAAVRFDSAGGHDRLDLFRLVGDSPPTLLDKGRRIAQVTFSSRTLRIAWERDGALVVQDLEKQARPRVIAPFDSIVPGGIGWSPDGRHLMAIGSFEPPDAGGNRAWTRLVYDAAIDSVENRAEVVVPWRVVWGPDSRSFAALDRRDDILQLVLCRRDAPPGERGAPLYRIPAGATARAAAWSARGTSLAVELLSGVEIGRPGEPAGTAAPAFPSDFATWTTNVVLVPTPGAAEAGDPAPPTLDNSAWHPSGEWYAAPRSSPLFGPVLWLLNPAVSDGFPAAFGNISSPRFSSDGRRLAWLDPAGRLLVLPLDPGPADPARARSEAAMGQEALTAGEAALAVRHYRNAVRLDPGQGRHYQGLGRAYRGIAAMQRYRAKRGYYVEGAARALFAACELDGRRPDVRLDFLDAMAERALLAGLDQARFFRDRAEEELAQAPIGGRERKAALDQAARQLTEAILRDPWNEHDRALLEGVLTRLAWKNPLDREEEPKRPEK